MGKNSAHYPLEAIKALVLERGLNAFTKSASDNARLMGLDRIATVAVNEFIFKQPVKVGDILSFFSSVTRIGNTSITVKVEVFAERFSMQGVYLKVTEANVTYVAIDAQGKPRPIARKQI